MQLLPRRRQRSRHIASRKLAVGLSREGAVFQRQLVLPIPDNNGNPVANVYVSAYSQSITGAPDLGFGSAGQTDAGGNYSVKVLSRANYQVTYTPPTPNP